MQLAVPNRRKAASPHIGFATSDTQISLTASALAWAFYTEKYPQCILEVSMTRGSKAKYSPQQKRKAEHIEESYLEQGRQPDEAAAIAWATVNKQSGGGEKQGGSGKDKSSTEKAASRRSSARRAAASRQGIPRRESLGSETKVELMKLARAKDIKGRSTMNKSQLVKALQHAGSG